METDILALTICATEHYQYAMAAQARAIHANLRHLRHKIAIILVGDKGLQPIAELYRSLFPDKDRVSVEVIATFKERPGDQNYKNGAQLLIAQMRSAAFSRARSLGALHCWNLDSDVIPKSSACYSTLRWLLDMPGAFYEVAISPYPSQGGGDMLTGRGTPEHPILQDFQPAERKIPAELQKELDDNKAACAKFKAPEQPPKELIEQATALNKRVEECPPLGNVFAMNAQFDWKRRGWLSAAYPGLGRGSIVPSDWCGFGNTLIGPRALDECEFLGYYGSGTEDLFVVWLRWHQIGIRIGSALHEPSMHVSRRSDGKYFVSFPRFITDADESKGECVGHIRILQRPFYAHGAGEAYDPANDGIPTAPADRAKTPAPAQVPSVALELEKQAIRDASPPAIPKE